MTMRSKIAEPSLGPVKISELANPGVSFLGRDTAYAPADAWGQLYDIFKAQGKLAGRFL